MPNETTAIAPADSALQLPAVPPPFDGVEPPAIRLKDKQTKALEAIMAGKSTADIITEAGIDRSTLWRWRTFDANFIAALNQWRHEVQGSVRDRVANIIEAAAETVHGAVRERDGRLSLSVLDKTGNLKSGPTTPFDPYHIFGAGIDDENGRHAAYEGFIRARGTLNAEQAMRVVQIFAMGIVADNDRLGYQTSPAVREMAKYREAPRDDREQRRAGTLATETGRGLSDEGEAKPAMLSDANASPPRDAPGPQSPTVVKARVAGYFAKVGTIFRK